MGLVAKANAGNAEIRRTLGRRAAPQPSTPPSWTNYQPAQTLTLSRLTLVAASDALRIGVTKARFRRHDSGRLEFTFTGADSVVTYTIDGSSSAMFDRAEPIRQLTGRDGIEMTVEHLGEILAWAAGLAQRSLTITENPTGLLVTAGPHRLSLPAART